jgi:redox-sensitive bicupin YhaK (pirin superfamily)
MITLRQSGERGAADHGWLKSFHSFSFAGYYDATHMGWGHLRVINEDRIAPGAGFGTHGHRDMEIISYVLSGGLAHKDSMGNGTGIPAGDVQRMSAGSGVMHSEFNQLSDATTHFFQIWILPNQMGVTPGYEQKTLERLPGQLQLVASPDGKDGSLTIHADASLYRALFDEPGKVALNLQPRRKAYVHLIRGAATVNGKKLESGDAALLDDELQVSVVADKASEVLIFDLTV